MDFQQNARFGKRLNNVWACWESVFGNTSLSREFVSYVRGNDSKTSLAMHSNIDPLVSRPIPSTRNEEHPSCVSSRGSKHDILHVGCVYETQWPSQRLCSCDMGVRKIVVEHDSSRGHLFPVRPKLF
eukprot:scaffold449_cov184-Amphora_coffeaeformis.AAC.11